MAPNRTIKTPVRRPVRRMVIMMRAITPKTAPNDRATRLAPEPASGRKIFPVLSETPRLEALKKHFILRRKDLNLSISLPLDRPDY
jgi:hypothetical protein